MNKYVKSRITLSADEKMLLITLLNYRKNKEILQIIQSKLFNNKRWERITIIQNRYNKLIRKIQGKENK